MEERELQELFCTKIGLEISRFKRKMLKQKQEVIFERVCQIDSMLSIYELLMEMSQKMEKEKLKKLIVFPDLLAFLYGRWLKTEDSHMQELQDTLTQVVTEIQETYEKIEKKEKEEKVA